MNREMFQDQINTGYLERIADGELVGSCNADGAIYELRGDAEFINGHRGCLLRLIRIANPLMRPLPTE